MDTCFGLIDMPDYLFGACKCGVRTGVVGICRVSGAEQHRAVRWATEPETARRWAERAKKRLLSAGILFHGGTVAISRV